jgi:hypothetical protein
MKIGVTPPRITRLIRAVEAPPGTDRRSPV